jgi:HK97 family phage major capsid protein
MERAHNLAARARAEGRDMTRFENDEAGELLVEAERIGNMPAERPAGTMQPLYSESSVDRAAEFVDEHGRRLHMLRPTEKLVDLPQPDNQRHYPLSIGKAIVGLATGKWTNARAEKLAMSEGNNAAGGFLVNDVFSRTLIDKARAQTRLVQAGALTMPWTGGDRLTLARVVTDPTFTVVAENTEIPESSIAFDRVGFTAHKIATVIKLSRELAEDSANAAEIIESTLAKAFAAELDRLGLVGSGSGEPNGLLNYTDVASTDSIGAIGWHDVHNAATAVRCSNYEPNGYILSPTISGDLLLTQSTDSGVWLGPPATLDGMQRLTTTNCPDANLFVGDFSQFVFGIRTNATLEVTTTGGDAFAKHQLWIKLTFRGDIGLLDSSAFHVLKGITT